MQDPITRSAGAGEAGGPAAPPQGEPEHRTTTPGAGERPPEETPELLDTSMLERDESGQLVLRSGDSVYKADTMDGLIKEVLRGVAEKDGHIAKLSAKLKVPFPTNAMGPRKEGELEQPRHQEIQLPVESEIYERQAEAIAKEYGIDPKMLNWSDQKWAEYQDSENLRDFQFQRIFHKVENAKAEIERRTGEEYTAGTAHFINYRTIVDEDQKVREMIAESDIDPEKFDYDAVLERVWQNQHNRMSNGVLRPGSLVAEAHREIMRMATGATRTKVRSQLESEIAGASEKANLIKSGPSSGERFVPGQTPAKNMDEAYERALRYFRSKAP